MTLEISLISLGLLVGFSLGLTGSGGSILAIPLLIYGAKLPVHQATFVSLLIVGCISAIGAIKQFIIKKIDWHIALIFSISGMIIYPFAVKFAEHVNDSLRLLLFAIFMLIAAWRMFASNNHDKPNSQKFDNKFLTFFKIFLSGSFSGALTGFFGAGGGFIILPILILIFSLPYKKAVGTSLTIITFISSSALITYFVQDVIVDVFFGNVINLLSQNAHA